MSKILLRMGLPFGTSSSSGHGTQSAGSEGDMELQARMDLKRKRMWGMGTSCRRLRKRKHFDNLISQADLLRMESQRLITALNITAQSNAAGEAQNSELRTRMKELAEQACALRDLLDECIPDR